MSFPAAAPPVGALGYVNAAQELVTQASDMGLRIDHVVHATGSAGTQAGLVAGLVALNSGIPVLASASARPKAQQEANVLALAERTMIHLGLPGAGEGRARRRQLRLCRPGYGIPTEGMVEAVKLVASRRDPARPGLFRARAWPG